MNQEANGDKFREFLDKLYTQVIEGAPQYGFEAVPSLANYYLQGTQTLTQKINNLIRMQNIKAATSGFVTNLGGLITLPITIPVDLAVSSWVQLRMICAIAHMCGYDLRHDKVRTLVYMCFVGMSLQEVLQKVGAQVASALTRKAIISLLSKRLIGEINKAIGVKLLTRFGTTGIVQIGKLVPILGGLVGATFNAVAMNFSGTVARDTFLSEEYGDYTGTAPLVITNLDNEDDDND